MKTSDTSNMRTLLNVSLFAHAVWLVLFAVVIIFGPYEAQKDVPFWLAWCEFCRSAGDSISTASEMGRLDVVSISLTVLGVVIAIAALGSYSLIKGAAKEAAAEEASSWLEHNIGKLITTEVVRTAILNDRIILTLANQVSQHISDKDDEIDSTSANQIATAPDDEEF